MRAAAVTRLVVLGMLLASLVAPAGAKAALNPYNDDFARQAAVTAGCR